MASSGSNGPPRSAIVQLPVGVRIKDWRKREMLLQCHCADVPSGAIRMAGRDSLRQVGFQTYKHGRPCWNLRGSDNRDPEVVTTDAGFILIDKERDFLSHRAADPYSRNGGSKHSKRLAVVCEFLRLRGGFFEPC